MVTASHERGLPPAVTAHLGERLVLRLPDRSAFAAFGLRPADVPDLGPGRAIDPTTGWEHQLFAPPADLAAAVEEVGERWPTVTCPPRPIPPLPTTVTADDLLPHGRATANAWWLPIGVSRTDGEVVTLPLRRGESLTVCGPPGRQRRAVVRLILDGVARLDHTVRLLVLGPGPVRADFGDHVEAPSGPADVAAWLATVLGATGPRVLVVEAADEMAGPSVERLARHQDADLAVVVVGVADQLRRPTHWARARLRSRSGVLLSATATDGDVFGVMLASAPIGGGGHAVVDGEVVPVLFAGGDEDPCR